LTIGLQPVPVDGRSLCNAGILNVATLTVGSGQEYATLASAIAASADGDLILVQPGTYTNDFATITTNITIEGNGGVAILQATEPPPNLKGILTIDANVTLINMAFTGAAVPDADGANGAGVRFETGNLVINNCYFYNNQDGLLADADSSADITINNSEFVNNGVSASSSPGYGKTHNLYVNQINQLTINNSYFSDPVVGNDIKSRALNTTIENSTIVDPNGTGSYQIDLPDGGNALIENNIIEKGPGAQNNIFISAGEEGDLNPTSSFTVSGNTVINNYGSGATMVQNDTGATADITDNTTYGFTSSQIANGPANVTDNNLLPISEAPSLPTQPPFPCFAAGTRILTSDGHVPVEALRVGQEVVVAHHGERVSRPIKWVGSRSVDLATHPKPELACPVRVRRDAFADGIPRRDLLLSPDHAVFVDDTLIPARLLINGGTITQDMTMRQVRYHHVELKAHSVILAEGLPCESYLDTGNRSTFTDGGGAIALHPVFVAAPAAHRSRSDACLPLATSAAAVEPVWRRLADRSAGLGLPVPRLATTSEPDLRLIVDNPGGSSPAATILPIRTDPHQHVFILPRGVTTVRIVSRRVAPAAVTPATDDRRRLGVNVQRIILERGADRFEIALDDPALRAGWWEVERAGPMLWRWTNGNAVLRLPAGTQRLELQIASGMRYPEEEEASARERPAAA
jgi:hypothetical protein